MLKQFKAIPQDLFQKNIDFWETAWSRVKKAHLDIPDVLDYIPEIPKVFKEHNCKHILDIACGSGWLGFYLQAHGFKVTGIDISESAIRLARGVAEEKNLDPSQIDFQAMDMFDMNFPENSFDGILINACFEHLDYARGEEFLGKIKKVIRNQGIMFGVFDKVASGERGTFEVLEDGSHQYSDSMRDGMLLRYYNDDELKDLFAAHQWQIESISKNKFESRIVVAKNIK